MEIRIMAVSGPFEFEKYIRESLSRTFKMFGTSFFCAY